MAKSWALLLGGLIYGFLSPCRAFELSLSSDASWILSNDARNVSVSCRVPALVLEVLHDNDIVGDPIYRYAWHDMVTAALRGQPAPLLLLPVIAVHPYLTFMPHRTGMASWNSAGWRWTTGRLHGALRWTRRCCSMMMPILCCKASTSWRSFVLTTKLSAALPMLTGEVVLTGACLIKSPSAAAE